MDGFALYKGMLQRTYPEYKWLDLAVLGSRLFPHRDVAGVKFFTAPLKPLTNNPGIGQRQQIYWRALRTRNVEILEGTFSFNRQYLPLHPEQGTLPVGWSPSGSSGRRRRASLSHSSLSPALGTTKRSRAGLQTVRQIRRGTLAASQLPPVLLDAQGRTIRKPPSWA